MSRFDATLRHGTVSHPVRCAILISGSGSGMEAMLEHQQNNPACGHTTVVVISDRSEASGVLKARNRGIEARCIPLPMSYEGHERRLKHEALIQELLEEFDVELILLSGYMRLKSSQFVELWAPRIINIHPSLLPAFPGAHAHRDVLASGVNVSGCTIHFVDSGMDTGQIIAQRRVPVFPDDSESSLTERIKIEEHRLYPMVIDQLVTGKNHPMGD